MSRTKKNLIRWVLGVLLLVDLGLVAVNWHLSSVPRVSSGELTSLRRQRQLLAADVARGDVIRKDLPAVEKQCDTFFQENLPPASRAYSTVVSDLGTLATHSGLQAENLNFHQRPADKRGVTELQIQLDVNGDYSSVVRFINGLQRSDSFYVLDGLSLTAGGEGGALRLNLRLRTFLRT